MAPIRTSGEPSNEQEQYRATVETGPPTQNTDRTTDETAAATQTVAETQDTQPKSVQEELDRDEGLGRESETIRLSRYPQRARTPPDRLNLWTVFQ